MKSKFILILVLLWSLFTSFSFWKECWQDICWNSPEEMFVKVEETFNADAAKGLHWEYAKDKITCDNNLSSIAYGFAKSETNLWKKWIWDTTNNWFGIKRWSGKFQIKWQKSMWMDSQNHLKYPSAFLSAYDFMYLIKYSYKCSLSQNTLFTYVWWENHWYIKNINLFVSYYQKFLPQIKIQIANSNKPKIIVNPKPWWEQYPMKYEELPKWLVFANKWLKINMNEWVWFAAVADNSKINIESRYSEFSMDIKYQKCDLVWWTDCRDLERVIDNIADENFQSSNWIFFYKMPLQNIWVFVNHTNVYYISDQDKDTIKQFSSYIRFN